MTWNYRIGAEKCGSRVLYRVIEVYYKKNGKPNAWCETEVGDWESLGEIRDTLNLMAEAPDKPVIDLLDFPKEIV